MELKSKMNELELALDKMEKSATEEEIEAALKEANQATFYCLTLQDHVIQQLKGVKITLN